MTVNQAGQILKDLRELLKLYDMLFNDMRGTLYKSKILKVLIKKCKKDIEHFEELLYNNELEDSYH